MPSSMAGNEGDGLAAPGRTANAVPKTSTSTKEPRTRPRAMLAISAEVRAPLNREAPASAVETAGGQRRQDLAIDRGSARRMLRVMVRSGGQRSDRWIVVASALAAATYGVHGCGGQSDRRTRGGNPGERSGGATGSGSGGTASGGRGGTVAGGGSGLGGRDAG